MAIFEKVLPAGVLRRNAAAFCPQDFFKYGHTL